MNMFKKLALAALLVPSSIVIGEPSVQPETIFGPEPESIIGNLQASISGFQGGFYKTSLGFSRLILDLSQNANAAGNYFAEHYWVLGGVTAATAGALGYLCYKRPSRPAWMSMQPMYQMVQNGRQWFSPVQPQQ